MFWSLTKIMLWPWKIKCFPEVFKATFLVYFLPGCRKYRVCAIECRSRGSQKENNRDWDWRALQIKSQCPAVGHHARGLALWFLELKYHRGLKIRKASQNSEILCFPTVGLYFFQEHIRGCILWGIDQNAAFNSKEHLKPKHRCHLVSVA